MSQQTSHGPFFFLMDNSALKQSFLHSYHQTFLPYHIIFLWLLTTTKILTSEMQIRLGVQAEDHAVQSQWRCWLPWPWIESWSLAHGHFYCSLSIGRILLSYFNPGRSTMWSLKLYHTVLSKLFYLYKLSGVSTALKKCSFVQASLSYFIFAERIYISPIF